MAEDDPVAGLLRQLTAMEGALRDLSEYAMQEVDADDLPSSGDLEARHQVLDDIWRQATMILIKLEGLGEANQRRRPLMQTYISAKAELIRLTKLAENQEGVNAGFEPPPNPIAIDQTLLANGGGKSTNLPRIELPKFSGSPTEWLSFKSRFEKRTATLTEDAEKYIFLQKGLESYEPAYNACKAFEDAGLSFTEAWKKLEERFYKKRVAFEGHFQKVLKLKRPPKQNAKALLNIVDAVDTMLTSARQIAGEPANSMDCIANGLLVCLVKDRLDEHTLTRLEDKLDLQTIYNWEQFKEEVERIANQLCCNMSAEHPKHTYSKVVAVAANPSHKVSQQNQEVKCSMCGHPGHLIYKCETFLEKPIPARLEMARQSQHCYNCLRKGHGIKQCKNAGRCRECKGRHHSLLHEARKPKVDTPVTTSSAQNNQSKSEDRNHA